MIRTERLERVDSGHVVTLLVAERRAVDVPRAGLDGAAVHDDRWTVVAGGGDETAGHVLVTSERKGQ